MLTSADRPVNVLPLSSPENVDDNPRSPKRRRISTDDTQQDIPVKAETDKPGADVSAVPVNQPLIPDGPAQNAQTKPPLEEHAQLAKGARAGQVQGVSISQAKGPPQNAPIPPPVGQAHSIATQPLQRPTPPRNNPLEHLPALDQQASQILTFLSRLTPAEAMGLSNNPSAPTSREYASLRTAFDHTRRLLSPGWPFLPQHDLGLRDSAQIEIIRTANQAIFMSSIFTGEIGLRDMDRSFLAVFVPEKGSLLPAQGSMYLELKMQGFITAWRTGAAPPDLVMRDMFGPDLDKMLLARRPGTTTLTDTERDFLRMLNSRRGILESAAKTNTLDQLPTNYKWEDFSREVSAYLINYIVKTPSNGAGAATRNNLDPTSYHDGVQRQGHFSTQGPPLGEPPVKEDYVALAAKAADIALRTTLGLSMTDRIPDMPSWDTPNPAPIPVMQVGTSTQQAIAPASIPIEAITPPISPMSEQDANDLKAPGRDSTGVDRPVAQSGLNDLDKDMSSESESRPGVSNVESAAKKESRNGTSEEMNKSLQPAKADPEEA